MVVARHLRDDASEFARLRLRFEEAFLLVEGGVAKAGQDLDEEEEDPDRAMDIVASVLMPLADEVGLMDLFNTQSTRLQFLEKEGSTGRLRPKENRYARISILDLAGNRVRKLSEFFSKKPCSTTVESFIILGSRAISPALTKPLIFSLPLRRRPIFPERRERSWVRRRPSWVLIYQVRMSKHLPLYWSSGKCRNSA